MVEDCGLKAPPSVPVEVRMEALANRLGEHASGETTGLLLEGVKRIRALKESNRYYHMAYERQEQFGTLAICAVMFLGALVVLLTAKVMGAF